MLTGPPPKFHGTRDILWADPKAGYSRHIAVVGTVAEEFAQVVRASGLEVQLHEGFPVSEVELGARVEKLARELDVLLPPSATFSVTFDAADGNVVVTLPDELRDESSTSSALSQEGARVKYVPDESVARPHVDVRGGGKMMRNGELSCTTGFTVATAGAATTGVATAGHCRDLDRYHGPAGNAADINFRDRHQGAYGDVEWFTTPNDPDRKEFYVNFGGTNPHPVTSVSGEGSLNRGDFFCGFGRASGLGCANIRRVTMDCRYPDPDGLVGRMVQMDDNTKTFGDSGGPWFGGNTAAGIHSGQCAEDGFTGDIWSKAHQLQEEAMGVHVMQN